MGLQRYRERCCGEGAEGAGPNLNIGFWFLVLVLDHLLVRWTEPKHDSKAQQDSNSTPIPGFLQVQDLFALELFSDDFLLNCCLPQINIVGVCSEGLYSSFFDVKISPPSFLPLGALALLK